MASSHGHALRAEPALFPVYGWDLSKKSLDATFGRPIRQSCGRDEPGRRDHARYSLTTVVPAIESCSGRHAIHDSGSSASRIIDCPTRGFEPSIDTSRWRITSPPRV